MLSSIASAILLTAGFAAAQDSLPVPTELIGTWSSKSNATLTGPGFYDPANEKFTEPSHTGISYSFSADGHFEEAYYRAIANPNEPKCPKGIMQWQHGTFAKHDNGSLTMVPIAVDGRQLYSDPCIYEHAVFTRYNTTELFKSYEVLTDPYHNIPRLNLYQWDGAPLMPLYLAMSPPQMLPTTTLNPLTTATAGGAKSTNKVKRNQLPMNHDHMMRLGKTKEQVRADRFWWFGIGLIGGGSVLYFFF